MITNDRFCQLPFTQTHCGKISTCKPLRKANQTALSGLEAASGRRRQPHRVCTGSARHAGHLHGQDVAPVLRGVRARLHPRRYK